MVTKQRCPKCNYLNEIGASHCVQCRAPLIQICPICGTPRPWYVPRCPHCESNTADGTAFADLFRETPTQRLDDRYVVKSVIATTRTSTLYRAVNVQQQPSLTYAIKEFSYVALFRPVERRQAESALDHAIARWSAIEHPALPRIVETFEEHEKQDVVFEFVDGWSIQRIISARRVRATPDLVRNWGAQLCDLLGCLHGQTPPLYAPFLSPSHVMVDTHGRIKLVGLGLGRLFTPDASAAFGSVRGYSAPELSDTGPTARTDAFALGRLLYALLTDRLLEKGIPRRLPLQRAVPGISSRLVKAVARAAHRDPDKRFASMADFRGALWGEQDGSPEPLDDWLQVAMSKSEETLPPETSQPISRQGAQTMADMGFIPDPRFRPQQASAPTPRPSDQQPRISIYPHAFVEKALKADEARRIVLTIRNKGDAELVGHMQSHVDWLRAPRKTIKLPAGRQAKVILSLQAALLHA